MFDSKHFIVRQLLADGLIKDGDVRRATEHAAAQGGDILASFAMLGIVTARRLAIARAKICEYPFADLNAFDIDLKNANLVPRGLAERVCAFPLFVVDGTATVAMQDPMNLQAIDQLRQILKTDVDPVICDGEQLKGLITRAYSLVRADIGENAGSAVETDLTTGEEPIVAALNQLIGDAIDRGTSDVHISPEENELSIRYRVDGVLVKQQGPPKSAHAGLIQRLKVLAKLDLAQTRKPQDGKIRFSHRGDSVDIRLSLVPTIHGENAVLRILRGASRIGSIADLGFQDNVRAWFEETIERPHGMILITGPTGSGKTTTLYTALNHINRPDVNIMTVEDPVEIRLPMLRQIQANPEVGLTFASALRSMLRQDPDIVLVGEVRDSETAKIAVQAALTGHLVFSTLHTNEAVGAIARLKDLEVPLFAINNALLCVIAQRLVRKVCSSCAAPELPGVISGVMPISQGAGARRGVGCAACLSSGYKGRVGVYEMLRITPRMQKLIEADASQSDIAAGAKLDGMQTMYEDGLEKVKRGITSVEELSALRTIASVDEEPAGSEDKPRLAA